MTRWAVGLAFALTCALVLTPQAEAVLKYDLRRASLLAAAFAPAPVPAPAPAPASDDPAVELESIPAAGHIDPVSSAVPSIVSAAKQTGHDIAAVFTGRKLLEVIAQDVAGRQLRQANKAQLKRLQGRTNDGGTQDQAQPEDAAAADQEDAAIEKDLVQIKEERLKRIQALPSSVWT